MTTKYRIGIDVGGTNTDAVLLDDNLHIYAEVKSPVTEDVTTGVVQALKKLLDQVSIDRSQIEYAMLGTTHCTNAIIERKRLNRVGVIRIGRPATLAIKPLTAWPEDMVEVIGHEQYVVGGGFEFDGRKIALLDEKEVRGVARRMRGRVESVAITGVFSPVNKEQEVRAAQIVREELGDEIPVSLSSEIGSIGLLERENATVLNAALTDVIAKVADAFQQALADQGINAKIFFGQNDGTLMSVEYARHYPILTIASGPTNSIRGAAFLSGVKDALVVDVGGTSSDIGVLVRGFPRESSLSVEIGGVRTNFRMPDLYSIGLGGGTRIRFGKGGQATIGPDSVGYRITEEAIVFGGETLTATDVAVACGAARIGNPDLVAAMGCRSVEKVYDQMVAMIEDGIDRMKTSVEDVPVVLVGGGSVLFPDKLRGASEVLRPAHFGAANAIGVAIAQVSGQIDRVFALDELGRDGTLELAKKLAADEAVRAGAQAETVEIVEVDDVPLAYLPGNATRIRIKAAGRLAS